MANIEVGRQYGCWLVLSRNNEKSEEYSKKQHHKRNVYNCECVICHALATKLENNLKQSEKNNQERCSKCPKEDLTGQRFGRLIVRGPSSRIEYGKRFWICDCDCGNVVEQETGRLKSPKGPKSCGCLHSEMLAERNRSTAKYGGDSTNENKRLHQIWSGMINRCTSESNWSYDNYGGRGIIVCDEWHNWQVFKQWALNNGYEDHLTIDRINTNGNYEPGNCRWTTQKVQANNTRSNKYLTYQGRTQTLSQWCDELGLDYHRTKARLNACGYSIEEAFEQEKYYFQKNVQHKGNKANMITDE